MSKDDVTHGHVRPQGRWLVRQIAKAMGETEAVVEASINALIDRGHLRVLRGAGPDGADEFQPLVHGEDTSALRLRRGADD
jgi:hypothetical protein